VGVEKDSVGHRRETWGRPRLSHGNEGESAPVRIDFRDVKLSRVARSPREFPRDGRPQVCFAGRSNVGKSSLLNTLVGARDLARTSKTPGRTREIHFFLVADRFYLVDLPGYGYAKVSRRMRRQWGRLIEAYLSDTEALRLMVVILDIRREPNEDDLDLVAWLESCRVPYVVALTKSDKVSGNEFARQRRNILKALGAGGESGAEPPDKGAPAAIRFSAKTGEGRNDLIRAILAALENPSRRNPTGRHVEAEE